MQTQFSLAFGRNIGSDGLQVSEANVRAFLRENVSLHFPGFTFTRTKGYWMGEPEDSFTLTILSDTDQEGLQIDRENVRVIAREYCALFHQEEVLVSEVPCTFEFVNAHAGKAFA